MILDVAKIDVVQVFEAFFTFAGNSTKTSLATGIDIETIEQLAAQGNWHARIKQLDDLSGNRQETQVALNRGINYVQTTRLRSLLDKVIRYLSEGSATDLVKMLTNETAHGPVFKTRALTDLVAAAESVQLMSQRCLGDTATERPAGSERKQSNIALSVMAALNAAEQVGLDSVEVVKQQLALPAKPNE